MEVRRRRLITLKNEHGFEVKVVADSNAYGTRITTFQLTYPRFIHAEFMTHRVFSRNASSSRAIPVERMEDLCEARPVHWGKNERGMSANTEQEAREDLWDKAKVSAVDAATELNLLGYHKQLVNRLTEPFQFIKVVVTATEWENFFKLRNNEAAQPEIHELARMMQEAMDTSEAEEFEATDWHVPYYLKGFWKDTGDGKDINGATAEEALVRSAAACARVSYNNHDGTMVDAEKDRTLYESLRSMEHMSVFEHQAKPMGLRAVNITEELDLVFEEGVTHFDRKGCVWSANFANWVQRRQMGSFYDNQDVAND